MENDYFKDNYLFVLNEFDITQFAIYRIYCILFLVTTSVGTVLVLPKGETTLFTSVGLNRIAQLLSSAEGPCKQKYNSKFLI